MAYEVQQTEVFESWLDGLADTIAKRAIAKRLVRVSAGLFGDSASVGDGVSELRVHVGAGYRAYFTIRGNKVIFMLCGGSKKTQKSDIGKAQKMAADLP